MTLTFKYRLYPAAAQVEALELHLSEACRLYNAALQERRDAWNMQRKRITCYDQARQLKAIRAAGDIGIASYTTADNVLRRVDHSFKAFFRRVRAGQKPGFPRFRAARRFDSLECRVGNGASIGRRLSVTGIGPIKVKWHRPIVGTPATVYIKREGHRWYASVVAVDVPTSPLSQSVAEVGIDVGLSTFATLSDGGVIANQRHERRDHAKARRAQRAVARCRRDSRNRRKAVARLASQIRRTAERARHVRDRTEASDRAGPETVCAESKAGAAIVAGRGCSRSTTTTPSRSDGGFFVVCEGVL